MIQNLEVYRKEAEFVVSRDRARNWPGRSGSVTSDLGYPRMVVGPDGKPLSVYYYNYGAETDRLIAATLFDLEAR